MVYTEQDRSCKRYSCVNYAAISYAENLARGFQVKHFCVEKSRVIYAERKFKVRVLAEIEILTYVRVLVARLCCYYLLVFQSMLVFSFYPNRLSQ